MNFLSLENNGYNRLKEFFMAGHSKWNNIKNKKGATDAKKAKEFAFIAKQIKQAVKEGGSDKPDFNPKLRTALDKARSANMPKEKIAKAIATGLGKTASGAVVHEILYEGYGPEGVAVLVLANTDNPTRTSAQMKYVFSRNGGVLAGPNAASFLFKKSQNQEYIPLSPIMLSDEGLIVFQSLLEALTQDEDVEEVFHSAGNVEEIN